MAEIRLVVDSGEDVLASRFFELGQRLIDCLDSLADTPTEWVITELRKASGVAALRAKDGQDDRPILRLVGGLAEVERGGEPEGWAPDAVGNARELVVVAARGAECSLQLVDGPMAEVIYLSQYLADRLAVIQPASRTIPSSLRGTITGVNVTRGNRASLKTRSGRVVRLGFPDSLRDSMRDALFMFVEVTGHVRQDGNGLPFSAALDDVRVVKDPAISWPDLLGIDPAATDGLPAAEYLRRIRGEE